jgi:hypothetical protein
MSKNQPQRGPTTVKPGFLPSLAIFRLLLFLMRLACLASCGPK